MDSIIRVRFNELAHAFLRELERERREWSLETCDTRNTHIGHGATIGAMATLGGERCFTARN